MQLDSLDKKLNFEPCNPFDRTLTGRWESVTLLPIKAGLAHDKIVVLLVKWVMIT